MALSVCRCHFGQGVVIKLAIGQDGQRHLYVLVLGQGPDNSARWIGNRSQSIREAPPRHNFHLLAQPDQDVVEQCNLLLVVGGAARDKKIRQAHQDGGTPAEVDIRASSGQFINQALRSH
jgi:hypothetical protein